MTGKEHENIFSSTKCLSESDLRGYAENNLSEQEKLRVEKHTVDCELCSDALEGYSQMNDPAGFGLRIASIDRKIDAKLSVESRFWNREKLSYIAAAAVLLMFCSIVFVLIDDVSQKTNQFITDELKQYEYEQNIPKEERTPFYDTESADKTVNNQNLAAEAAARKGDRAGNKDKNQDVAAQVPTSGKLEGSLKEMNESEIGNRSRYLGATRATPSEPEPDMIDEISIEPSADRVAAGATGTVTYGWNKADNDEALTEDVVLYDLERSGDERKDAKPAKKDKELKSLAGLYQEVNADQKKTLTRSKGKKAKKGQARPRTEQLITNESYFESQVIVSKSAPVTEDYSIAESEELSSASGKPALFLIVEELPQYQGGEQKMLQYLMDNIQYPDSAIAQGIEGTVMVRFKVEADSSVTNVRSLNDIGGGCDKEAVRVVKSMDNWIPAREKGKPISVEFNLPVKFKLKK